MKFNKLSKFLLPFATFGIVGATTAGFIHWGSKDFKPVLMNFEAYISEEAAKEIGQKFQYKVFQEITEFSRAIESQRIVGGVASEFEIARLAIGGKLKKVKYEKILRQIPELATEVARANAFEANGMLKKEIVKKYLREETMQHIDSYNSYLKDLNGKGIDVDKDGKADEMWEFMIPYYIQDKVVAYTTGVYNTGGNNAEGEPNQSPLRPNSYKSLSEEEKEKGIRFDDQSFVGITKKLKEKKYNKFTWTQASGDNLLIGSELKNSDAKPPARTYSGTVTPSNYRSMVDGFLEVVQKGTGAAVSNIATNKFVSSGSDILQSLIDPTSNSDVGVIYNGDVIDALYSEDNFASVPDGQVKYIRPKNNITLLEGFVLASYNTEEINDKIYDVIYNSIYKGVDMTEKQLFQEIASFTEIPFYVENAEGELVPETDASGQVVYVKNGKKNYGLTIDYSNVPILRNYDYINYTPSWKADFNLIKKLYFNDATTSLDDEDETTLLHKNGSLIMFEVDQNASEDDLLTALEAEKEKINFEDIDNEVSDPLTKTLLNAYITQQKKQTVYGGMVDENTPEADIYEVTYEALRPISDKLRSEVITYYNIKTKN